MQSEWKFDASSRNVIYTSMHVLKTQQTKWTLTGSNWCVFGRSDAARRYHPISYMLTSREEEKDFCVFYDELLRLANSCNIFFRPYYVMQDAASASAVALRRVVPLTYVLMCWFHMKKCILDSLHRLHPKHHNTVVKDVDRLHFSLNPADFEEKRKQIINKWIGEEWLAWNAYFWPQ